MEGTGLKQLAGETAGRNPANPSLHDVEPHEVSVVHKRGDHVWFGLKYQLPGMSKNNKSKMTARPPPSDEGGKKLTIQRQESCRSLTESVVSGLCYPLAGPSSPQTDRFESGEPIWLGLAPWTETDSRLPGLEMPLVESGRLKLRITLATWYGK